MDHSTLKTIIYDQHDVIRNADIVPREYILEDKGNYVLTGLRRAGKSTLLYDRARKIIDNGAEWEQIIYVNFEDDRLTGMTLEDLDDISRVQSELSDKKGYYFFDEIQNIDGWERFVRRLADRGESIQITGSNAKMLSRDIAERLGGRFITKNVRPYNFSEYLTARGIPHSSRDIGSTKSSGKIVRAFGEYLHEGGFPGALNFKNKREYISGIYQNVLLNDIAVRNGIRNDHALRLLIKKIAETVTNEVSYSSLHGALNSVGLKVSKDTIIDYIEYAGTAYLLFSVRNYFAKISEREGNPKYYFGDNGLFNLFLIDKDPKLLENLIAVELKARYGDEVFFLKSTKTGVDADFYIPDEGTAIQVAYSLDDSSRTREIDNLVKTATEMKNLSRCIIVTMEQEETIEKDGVKIEVIPAYKFLLSR